MTRSKALEISVAGPKRVFALFAELHRDSELLLNVVYLKGGKYAFGYLNFRYEMFSTEDL